MAASNAWAEHAALFRRTLEAHAQHESAKAELKALVPADAKEACGHGVRARRSRAGSLSVSLMGEERRYEPLQ